MVAVVVLMAVAWTFVGPVGVREVKHTWAGGGGGGDGGLGGCAHQS